MTQPEDLDFGTPEADAAEQAAYVEPQEADTAVSRDIEAPEWDAEEQSRSVPLDDEYR
jgi:hypothetical protein